MRILPIAALLALCVTGRATRAQAPDGTRPSDACAEMVQRGNQMMGFSASKTQHHVRLFADGGEIEVTANDPNDTQSREQIRRHLSHIAAMFSEGDFDAPMFIHATTPPGVPTMKRLRERIRYTYEQTATGGRVRIGTQDGQALDAVHAFLLFQIVEHKTGDSGIVARDRTCMRRRFESAAKPLSVRGDGDRFECRSAAQAAVPQEAAR
jgi:hypothetical protein